MNKKFGSIDGFKTRQSQSLASKKVTNGVSYYKPLVAGKKTTLSASKPIAPRPIQRAVAQLANREVSRQNRSVMSERSSLMGSTKTNSTVSAPKHKSFLPTKRSPEKQLDDFFDVPDGKKSKPAKPKKSKKRLIIKLIILTVLIVIGFFGYRYISRLMKAANVIGGGNIIDILKKEPLKQDQNGRTTFLLFGTESNDLNSQHGGPLLTDSLMVVSYDNNTKQASMISIPRDLWIKHEKTCFVGNYAKINTVYQCGSDNGKDQKSGAEALVRKISQVIGLDIQYYAHIQFQAVVKLVDAVGGVEVMIESPDPRGIYDPNFDWQCNYKCTLVKYKNGPTGLMDGQRALALMRARNAQGGYGLPNSNFDRENNQRKVLIALAKKMTDNGVTSNVEKMTGILETLGDYLRTNLNAKEIRSMMMTMKEIANQFESNAIESVSLIEVVRSGNINGQSVIMPQAGVEQYGAIHKFIKQHISQQPFMKEKPSVTVLNGSGKSGLAQKLADQLSEQGFEIVRVGNASGELKGGGLVFQKAGIEKPKSYEYLQKTFSLTTDVAQQAKYSNESADFVIVIGPDTVIK